jgi:predicted nicotinamide N-methyase
MGGGALRESRRGAVMTDPMPTAPERAAMERLLRDHAPLTPVALCPEISVHQAHGLMDVWEAAERLAGGTLPSPFWAYAWPAGSALARVILDDPRHVRGRKVLDFGGGGGVAALAAAYAGAAAVTVNDIDPWALMAARIAADAQQLPLSTLLADLCADPSPVDAYDVILCSDLAYERQQAPRQRHVLERARLNGATVLVADAGRTYFDPGEMRVLAEYAVDVPEDLEGTRVRLARVYGM